MEGFPQILDSFLPSDITMLILNRGLPDHGHVQGKEKLSGGKAAKQRVTPLVCANMDGTDKPPLLMIGKPKQPRCFPKTCPRFHLLHPMLEGQAQPLKSGFDHSVQLPHLLAGR